MGPAWCAVGCKQLELSVTKLAWKAFVEWKGGIGMVEFDVKTRARDDLKDITALVQQALSTACLQEGLCTVFVPHTTAGLTINENADPDVVNDLLYILDRMVPWDDPKYTHREGNGAAHVKSSMMGCSLTIPVRGGQLVLGTWQGVYLCEFDGPRTRRVQVQVVGTSS